MKSLSMAILLLLASQMACAGNQVERLGSRLINAGVECIQSYLSGRAVGAAGVSQDTRRLLDTTTGEYWVLAKAESTALNQSSHWLSSHVTAQVITYGLLGSILLTLFILGVGIRELAREP